MSMKIDLRASGAAAAALVLSLATCAGAADAGPGTEPYEQWEPRSAKTFLPSHFLSSPHHRVADEVVTVGYQDNFVVESDFGRFRVRGDAMLRRNVREIHALAAMAEVTRTEAFAQAAAETLKSPFAAAQALVTHPADTVSGVPQGIGHIFTSLEQTIVGDASEYEDSEVTAMLTVSKFKRQYASDLGIDVYTSNKRVQEELNRIGWASALGNLAPGVLTLPASAPAIAVAKGFGWVETFNEVLQEKTPGTLRAEDEAMLKEMRVDPELIERFLDQPVFSPRHETVLTRSLYSLKNATGRELLIRAAVRARNEGDAFFFQQVAEMLAGYNREKSKIKSLHPLAQMVAARAENGHLVLVVPGDYGRWTGLSAPILRKVTTEAPDGGAPTTTELWVTGTVSPRLREEAIRLGIAVTENVDEKIGMMD